MVHLAEGSGQEDDVQELRAKVWVWRKKGRTHKCPVTHLLTLVVSKPEKQNDNHYHL